MFMRTIYKLKSVLLTFAIAFVGPVVLAQGLYISEVMFSPGGDDIPREFVEIMGTPNAVIPANTYLVCVEGDPNSQGRVKMFFDFSDKTIGSNGFFAYQMGGNTYENAGGSVLTATGSTGWDGLTEYTAGSGTALVEIESGSISFLLVQSTNPILISDDIDSSNDGEIDITGWTILDGIAFTDDDFENSSSLEYAYSPLIYGQTVTETVARPSTSTYIQVSFSSDIGYFARVGRSTSKTDTDWVAGAINSATPAASGDFKLSSTSLSNLAYASTTFTAIGGPNFTLTYVGSSFTSSDDKGGTEPTNADYALEFADNYTSTADMICHSLTINSGNTLTIATGHTLTVNGNIQVDGSLVIESGASLITKNGNTIGSVIINRNTNGSALGYSFVGSPVASDAGITGANLGSITYSYDETLAYAATGGPRWVNASTTQLVPGIGYAQAGQSTISFIGIPNDGDIVVNGLTYSAGTANEQGWNLLSNPYPAAISASAFSAANTEIDAAIYLWNDPNSGQGTNSDYITVTDLGSVNGDYNGNIGAMQGFFVKVKTQGTASVTFTEDMRVAGSNDDANFFRKANENPLNIKLAIQTDKGFYNETLIGLRSDATSGTDRIYDAAKLVGNENIAFYSLINDNKFAIQALPIEQGIATELAFNIGESSELKLSVVELSGLENGMTFILTDKITGLTYDLSEINSIDFSASKGSDQNRFTLTYAAANVLAIDMPNNQPLYRYLNDQLVVTFNKSLSIAGFSVYDLSGKIILENSEDFSANELIIPISNKGINIISIVTSEGTFTRKFLF